MSRLDPIGDAGTKVSAGAVVRESIDRPANVYGDPRGAYRVRPHEGWTRA